MHNCSSDSLSFRSNHDLFYSVKGIGSGVWGLREMETKTPVAPDTAPPPTDRVVSEIYRILRDTPMARRVKKLHDNRCQICGTTIKLRDGGNYSEAHHIRPLGAPHNGPDVAENILVLCPNHHVECDYGVIGLSLSAISRRSGHVLSQSYIDYHNTYIRKLEIS